MINMLENTKTYFPNLDSPRFFAFLLIFIRHVIYTQNPEIKNTSVYSFYNVHLNAGVLALDFYITLSGFLITWIIIEEYEFTEKFNLLYFWQKRSLRILPLYFSLVALGYIMIWGARNYLGETVNNIPPLPWLLTFTLNFYIIKHGQAFLFFIVFLWIISVQEQFYVLWGLVMKYLKKKLVPVCIFLIIASLVFRIWAIHQPQNLLFNSLSWIGNFAAGALVALFCMRKGKIFSRLTDCPKWVSLLFYLLLAANILFFDNIYSSSLMIVPERLIASLLFIFIIFEQSFVSRKLVEMGKSNLLNYLGRISYGLFCYHGLVILLYERVMQQVTFTEKPLGVYLINPLIIFALTVIISALSYEYFEKPVMYLSYRNIEE